MLVVAHLSDTHLDGSARSHDRALAVMGRLGALPGGVDAVLVTGDIADHGLVSEYEEAAALFDLPVPVLTTPGNHDVRGAYRKVLLGGDAGGGGPVNRAAEVGGVVFLLCDSTIPGEDGGFLDEETLAWMEAELRSRDAGQPVFVCCHHPPAMLHAPFIDDIRLAGEQRLAALIDRHPQVIAVLCGHAHTPAASLFSGRPLLIAPGVVSALMLPWESGEVLDFGVPPSFAFHILDDGGRLTTHYRTVC
jgi:Icc protein